MDLQYAAVVAVMLTCMAFGHGEKRADKKSVEDTSNIIDSNSPEDMNEAMLRDGRSSAVFRYGRSPGVFRYGKRAPVFRYGKRSESEDRDTDELMKRIFRWGKRADGNMKRLFRYGKRSEDEDNDMKRMVFRYGKRAEDPQDWMEADKRRIFNFGKRTDLNDWVDVDVRSDTPHVPFRFGE